jgi:type I restriction enzyme S subunit
MRYKEYKESGLKWVEKIPSHWEVKRLASVVDIRKEKNDPIKTNEILSLSAKYGVTPYSERKEKGGNRPKSDLSKYNICYKGDILVNSMNVVSGAVGKSNYFGAISPVYYALETNDNNDTDFIEFIFRNYDFQRSMVGLGKGIMMNESDDGVLSTVCILSRVNYKRII